MKRLLIISIILFLAGLESHATSNWTQKANFGGIARHRTTSFSIGNKGYMGLGHYNSGPGGNIHLADFWEYDPGSNAWTQKADFGGGPRYHAVGESFGNKAYVGTGRSPGSILMTDWWEFDPIANTWTAKSAFPGTERRGAVCFKIDGYLFVGTGQIPSGFTNDFFAYDVENDQWLGGIPVFPGSSRTSAASFVINNKGYVGTGGVGCGTTDFYEYKLSTNQWIQRADVGTLIRQEAAGFSVNGKGYIAAGDNCSSGTNYQDVWEYDPNLDTWTQIDDFGGAARRYLDAFVIGNRAFCGLGTSGVNYSDLWEFDAFLSTIQRDLETVKVDCYPNPIVESATFTISNIPQGGSANLFELKILNLQGQVLFEDAFEDTKLEYNRENIPAGLYVYHITYEGNTVRNGKLIFE
ncbi:MAG: hypothetical protein BM555_03905 [Crocinitomix sp. MedPE-SWsnd]|nr:MAG: hypothetical protein BM555_03905 [Crocinitomix sp. MedPE-SWsnd]